MESLKDKVDLSRLPQHVAVIMDGNGRWARKHGKPRVFGHRNGVKAVREVTEAA
ncbi:MAG: undecaprenyl diphosphate synthase family protein, partial [Saprospiraceae bacterium]|nr:undecaprenyl diphosphate synthase family protein [Saprospiraceae bacterium]